MKVRSGGDGRLGLKTEEGKTRRKEETKPLILLGVRKEEDLAGAEDDAGGKVPQVARE